MEYPKLNSLWKRNQDKSFIVGDYSEPEFGNIKNWLVTEKIDGTNIRIIWNKPNVSFAGRTDKAQVPAHLLKYLQDTFTQEKMNEAFYDNEKVIIYGEGYGNNIQASGKDYSNTVCFRAFDIWVGGWWLRYYDVNILANSFGVDVAPLLGIMEEDSIVEYVKSKPLSIFSKNPQMMEGIVARAYPLVLFRHGKPIMWKLKCRDVF